MIIICLVVLALTLFLLCLFVFSNGRSNEENGARALVLVAPREKWGG